ncbi:MAG: hypothetical protein LBD48_05450 [Treponema sp.]|jgi:hypothetical protein|nr:hypothetical protein [Treponema sp.]
MEIKKTIALLGLVFLVMPVFCEVVKSDILTSKYGISYTERQKSNYIQKNGYSFHYLGNGTWEVKTLGQISKSSSANDFNGSFVVVIVIIAGIIIVIGVSVYNKTEKNINYPVTEFQSFMEKEEIILEYNTYNTSLTPQDIVLSFPGNAISYLSASHFYLCNYTIFQGESEQNYAWHFKIIKNSYKWGTVFTLQLHISNGFFCIKTSTSRFNVGDKTAECLDYWKYRANQICEDIAKDFKLFVQESLIVMKLHNRNYDMNSQQALACVVTNFMPKLLQNSNGYYGDRERERELENKMAEREAYLAAMRRAMRRGYNDDYWDD